METISWIHLSDLHLTQEKLPAEKDCILKKLFLDIKKREQISPDLKDVDMIFITGDITQSGKEFDVFDRDVLSKILESLGLDPEKDKNKVFIVPGNHDVDRDKLNGLFPRSFRNIETVKQVIENQDLLPMYLERQGDYFRYFENNYSEIKLIDNHIYAKETRNSKYKIMILGFNSSWCAGEKFESEDNMTNADKMILGRPQLLRLIQDFDTSEYIIISLLHHDLHSFKSFEEHDVIESLEEESDFILHGHKHKLRTDDDLYSNVYRISAGTTDTKDNIGYNYVVVKPDKKSITVYHRKYDKKGVKFTDDKILKNQKFNKKLKSKKYIRNKDSFTNESDNIETQKEYIENAIVKLNQEEKAEFKSLMSKGFSFLSNNNYKEAAKCYEAAKKIDPSNEDVYIANGLLKYELGYYDLAIDDLEKSIKINPKIPFSYLLKGLIRRDLNQPKQAIRDLDDAIKHNPNDSSLYKQRGNLKYYLGSDEKNILYLEKSIEDYTNAIILHNDDAKSYFYIGNANYKIGKLTKNNDLFEKAVMSYKKAIGINPKLAIAYNNRGNAKGNLGRHQEAIEDYDKAIELDSKYAGAFYNRGNAKNVLGCHHEAIEDYNKSIEIDPKNVNAYVGRGMAKGYLGRYEEEIEDFDKAIEIDTKYSIAYNNRGIAYYYNSDFQKAKNDFNKAIECDPKNINARICRGRLFLVLGDIKEGFNDCEKTIDLDDKNSVAYLNRSIANLLLGTKEESRKDYEKAVHLANEQNNEQAKKEIAKCFDSDGNLLSDWNIPKRDDCLIWNVD